MKITTLCMTTILAGGLLVAYPVMAAPDTGASMTTTPSAQSGATSDVPPAPAAQSVPTDQQLQTASSEIVGNISIANIALVYGMHDDALSHINAARQAISTLNGQMTPYSPNAPLTAGKLSYKTAQGESDYWIPVVNDRFSVQSFDGEHLASKKPDIDVTDAQIVHYKMVLDIKVADEQLAKAQTAIGQKQYDVAMTALQNVSKGAITETVIEDRPMEAARDNLILSKELLSDKDYRGASFALKHASKELAQVEKDNPDSADNAHIKKMRVQIDKLQASIAKKDPSMLKTAETKIDHWIKDVKAKM